MQSISPLRYPGGKSRIYSKVAPLVFKNNFDSYAEPFSGGFGIGLLLLREKLVKKVYINDLDINIYSFWKLATENLAFIKDNLERVSKFTSYKEWLNERINQKSILESKRYGYKRKGWATFFLNRVNISGILHAGPIGGKNQKSLYKINCRFNFENLKLKLEWIHSVRHKIFVSNLNYDEFINSLDNKVFIFLDPPYVIKGGDLYMNNFKKEDHILLRDFLLKSNKSWIMTYDNENFIKSIYNNKNLYLKEFNLKHYAGKYKIGQEIFISNSFRL